MEAYFQFDVPELREIPERMGLMTGDERRETLIQLQDALHHKKIFDANKNQIGRVNDILLHYSSEIPSHVVFQIRNGILSPRSDAIAYPLHGISEIDASHIMISHTKEQLQRGLSFDLNYVLQIAHHKNLEQVLGSRRRRAQYESAISLWPL